MKKIVLIATVLLSCINLNAQDATNDATWEETIGFIKKHEENFTKWHKEAYDEPGFTNNKFQVKISNDKISTLRQRQYKAKWDDVFSKKEVNLFELREAIESNSGVNLYFITPQKFIKKSYRTGTVLKTYNHEYSHLRINNSELRSRLLKAFQHLAYLAAKKREEARKASGDKF